MRRLLAARILVRWFFFRFSTVKQLKEVGSMVYHPEIVVGCNATTVLGRVTMSMKERTWPKSATIRA